MMHRRSFLTRRTARFATIPAVLAALLCGAGCVTLGLPNLPTHRVPTLLGPPPTISADVDPRWMGVNLDADPLDRGHSGPRRVAAYFMSRLLDTLDMVTINVGVGPAMHLEFHATNFLRLGAGGAWLASVGTGEAPRQYGFFARGVGELSAGPMQFGSLEYDPFLATGSPYDDGYSGMRVPWDQMYRKQRDYWAFGFAIGFFIVGGQFEVHPVQMFDWLVGWFGKDPLRDDH